MMKFLEIGKQHGMYTHINMRDSKREKTRGSCGMKRSRREKHPLECICACMRRPENGIKNVI